MSMVDTERPPRRTVRCRHHWRIAPPDGPLSEGRCLRCGARREFRNALETASWGSDDNRWVWSGERRSPRRSDDRIADLNVVEF